MVLTVVVLDVAASISLHFLDVAVVVDSSNINVQMNTTRCMEGLTVATARTRAVVRHCLIATILTKNQCLCHLLIQPLALRLPFTKQKKDSKRVLVKNELGSNCFILLIFFISKIVSTSFIFFLNFLFILVLQLCILYLQHVNKNDKKLGDGLSHHSYKCNKHISIEIHTVQKIYI